MICYISFENFNLSHFGLTQSLKLFSLPFKVWAAKKSKHSQGFCALKVSYRELGGALDELGYRWKSLFCLMKVSVIFSNLEVKEADLYGSVSQHLVPVGK